MGNENEFEFEGKQYIAECGHDCWLCAMDEKDTCYAAPACTTLERADGRSVIFVEKRP